MISVIQLLRALAAMLVVHAHAAGLSGLHLRWTGGTDGVDLFFVISGFIITHVVSRDSSQFMKRRLIRIVPIYWASTLALYALVRIVPSLFHSVSGDPGLLVRSLLFVPDPTSAHHDGILHPTLGAGWTLNYEMYFYVAVWLALMVSRRWATVIASMALASFVVLVQTGTLGDSPLVAFYGSPIVLEFIYGVAAYYFVDLVATRVRSWPPGTTLGLSVIAAAGILALAFNRELFGHGPRCVLSGIPAFAIVCSAVLLERCGRLEVRNRTLLAVGDASYVLYLLHPYIIFVFLRALLRAHTFAELAGQVVVLGLVAVACAISVLVYQRGEKPMLRWLKSRVLTRSARAG